MSPTTLLEAPRNRVDALAFDTFPIPRGSFSIAMDENGTVVATAFGDESVLRKTLGTLLDHSELKRNPAAVRAARAQVLEYFAGKRRAFDLPLAPHGTEFQQKVWTALQRIPFGQTRSYGEIATAIGNPKACRAVGLANGANPICLLIPCHRVIGSNGTLTGFSGGLDIKQQLLEHEGLISRQARNDDGGR